MKPIFIVGMNGSGTTMLLDHLDRHPTLFGFPLETKILPYYLTKKPLGLDLQDDNVFLRLFLEMGKSYPFLVANGGTPVMPPVYWRSLPRTAATIFDTIMSYFAARNGKLRWCEKSPMHVQHISAISSAFPDAQFIHMIRDGRDCAASFHRRWAYTPKSTIYRWNRVVTEGRLQGLPLGRARYLEVYYERLTEQPGAQLADICKYLGLEFVEDVMHAGRDASRVKGLSERQMVKNSGKFRTYFTPRQIEALERIAGSTLTSLGYETGQSAGCYVPPVMLRTWWRLFDRLRFATRLVIGKARSPQPFPWRLMASRARRSLRHMLSERF